MHGPDPFTYVPRTVEHRYPLEDHEGYTQAVLTVYSVVASEAFNPFWVSMVDRNILKQFCEAYLQYPKKDQIFYAEHIKKACGEDAERLKNAFEILQKNAWIKR